MTSLFSLYQGDCTAVLATLPQSSVDLVVTDPPYVCRYRDRAGRAIANDDNPAWIAPAFREIFRVMKPDSLCVSFYGWQHVEAFMRAWKEAGLAPVGHLVWPKEYASRTGYLAARHEQAFPSRQRQSIQAVRTPVRRPAVDLQRQQAAPDPEGRKHPRAAHRGFLAARRHRARPLCRVREHWRGERSPAAPFHRHRARSRPPQGGGAARRDRLPASRPGTATVRRMTSKPSNTHPFGASWPAQARRPRETRTDSMLRS